MRYTVDIFLEEDTPLLQVKEPIAVTSDGRVARWSRFYPALVVGKHKHDLGVWYVVRAKSMLVPKIKPPDSTG